MLKESKIVKNWPFYQDGEKVLPDGFSYLIDSDDNLMGFVERTEMTLKDAKKFASERGLSFNLK